jgi:cell division transport system permease protein
MTKKVFKSYRYDIALEDEEGASLISWLSGLMVFFMALSLGITFILSSLTNSWILDLSGKMTIEIPAPDNDGTDAAQRKSAFDQAVTRSLRAAQKQAHITSAKLLSAAEVRELVKPWLGADASGDLPLPALIDIDLAAGADAERVKKELTLSVDPSARIDTHGDTVDGMRQLIHTVQFFFFILTAAVVFLSSAAIAGLVRAKLAAHKDEVETLHLLGAEDTYISRQFRLHTLRGTFKGALGGVILMALTMAAAAFMTKTLDSTLLPHLQLMPLQWTLLMLSPIVAACMIAHLTAQRTAIAAISRLP